MNLLYSFSNALANTLYAAIRAIYAAVTLFRFQYLMTGFALIKPLTSIRRHYLHSLVTTLRTSDLRAGNYFCHLLASGLGQPFFIGHIKSTTDTVIIKIKAA